MTYDICETDDGFIVRYLESGTCVWTELYATLDEIRTAYRDEIVAGRMEGAL